MLAAYAWQRPDAPWLAPGLIALGTLLKLFPGAAFAVILIDFKNRTRGIWWLAGRSGRLGLSASAPPGTGLDWLANPTRDWSQHRLRRSADALCSSSGGLDQRHVIAWRHFWSVHSFLHRGGSHWRPGWG